MKRVVFVINHNVLILFICLKKHVSYILVLFLYFLVIFSVSKCATRAKMAQKDTFQTNMAERVHFRLIWPKKANFGQNWLISGKLVVCFYNTLVCKHVRIMYFIVNKIFFYAFTRNLAFWLKMGDFWPRMGIWAENAIFGLFQPKQPTLRPQKFTENTQKPPKCIKNVF